MLLVQFGRREVGIGDGQGTVGIDRHRFKRARVDQPAHHRVADLGMIGELADCALPALDCGQRLLALRRQPVGLEPGRPIFGQLARAFERRSTTAGSSAAREASGER